MKTKGNIDSLVEETLDSASGIKTATTPPFFKEKVLNKMVQSAVGIEDNAPFFRWLTPRYQVIILIVLIITNAVALFSITEESSNVENVEDFAEIYGLSEPDTDLYFYDN